MTEALEGIKVIDLSRYAPGPYCTMILADLGADVIRVEEHGPLTGRRAEQARGAPITPEQTGWLENDHPANSLNRNKRSIALNLKTEGARQALYKLAETSDVLVEEFRPGVTKRLGIDYETLSQINPRLIYCAITGFGQDGPYRDRVGHDINYISIAGALSYIGPKGGPPIIPGNLLGDFAGGGMHGAIAILAALIARGKTGKGQFVDVAMLDGVVSLINTMLNWSLATGHVPKPGDHVNTGAFPFYNVYETSDGKYVTLGSIEPWFWSNLCRALGCEDFIPYQWDTGTKRDEIFAYFREIFKTKTREEWFQVLGEGDIGIGKVNSLDEVASDPQIQHRHMFVVVEDPKVGKVRQVGIPFKLSATPCKILRPTPVFGQHTEEVLQGLGYTKSQIKNLRQDGCVN